MSRVKELEAELEVARLEEKLTSDKKKNKGRANAKLKLELREARRAHRLQREGETA